MQHSINYLDSAMLAHNAVYTDLKGPLDFQTAFAYTMAVNTVHVC